MIDELCRGVRPYFSDHLDHERLPLLAAIGVRLHLTFCPMCRRTYQALRQTRAALAELRDADPSDPSKEPFE